MLLSRIQEDKTIHSFLKGHITLIHNQHNTRGLKVNSPFKEEDTQVKLLILLEDIDLAAMTERGLMPQQALIIQTITSLREAVWKLPLIRVPNKDITVSIEPTHFMMEELPVQWLRVT